MMRILIQRLLCAAIFSISSVSLVVAEDLSHLNSTIHPTVKTNNDLCETDLPVKKILKKRYKHPISINKNQPITEKKIDLPLLNNVPIKKKIIKRKNTGVVKNKAKPKKSCILSSTNTNVNNSDHSSQESNDKNSEGKSSEDPQDNSASENTGDPDQLSSNLNNNKVYDPNVFTTPTDDNDPTIGRNIKRDPSYYPYYTPSYVYPPGTINPIYVPDGGGGGGGGNIITLPSSPIPEPSTYLMFILGLGVMFFVKRHRDKKHTN